MTMHVHDDDVAAGLRSTVICDGVGAKNKWFAPATILRVERTKTVFVIDGEPTHPVSAVLARLDGGRYEGMERVYARAIEGSAVRAYTKFWGAKAKKDRVCHSLEEWNADLELWTRAGWELEIGAEWGWSAVAAGLTFDNALPASRSALRGGT